MHSALYDFGYGRNDGNRTVVGRKGVVTGLVDGKYKGMFPGCRDFGESEARVDQVEKYRPNDVEAKADKPHANAILTAGR